MAKEFEAAGLASLGALTSDRSGASGQGETPCANCGTPVTGRFCSQCGQLAADFHRPIWSLLTDVLADAFSLDGRIARTLPALMFRPGHVTRAYLDGKRARYVPPFRLFLLASLVFFFSLFAFGDRLGWFEGVQIVAGEDGYDLRWRGTDPADGEQPVDFIDPSAHLNADALSQEGQQSDALRLSDDAEISEGIAHLYNNQQVFFAAVRTWTPRLSFLLLPIFALLLGAVFLFRRDVYLYDHLIASLHFQSFLYLGGAMLMWAGLGLGPGVAWIAILGVPAYLFGLLRGAYRAGVIVSLIRTVFLLVTTSVSLLMLVIAIIVVGALQV